MAVRTDTNPHRQDLHPELERILMRNGLQAHVTNHDGVLQLLVQGHDSPLLRYDITPQQARALADWGTNSADKKAYDTLVGIIGNDFYLPRSFTNARNANGRVAMGLHGYRIGTGEYGRTGYGNACSHGFGAAFLGWTPRQQDGFHLRRVDGQPFLQHGGPMVAERPDGRIKPGEMQSGSYGFYYKGEQKNAPKQTDVLKELSSVIVPVSSPARSTDPAQAYKDLIASDVYFSGEKWTDVLSTHGLIIDREARTLTVQSQKTAIDMIYDLTDRQIEVLTADSVTEHSVRDRIVLMNDIIGNDFKDAVTMDMLNSTDRIGLELKPDVAQQFQEIPKPQVAEQSAKDIIEIERSQDGKIRMTAVLGGERITREITERQYDKFMAMDDMHRQKMLQSIFSDTKVRDRLNLGVKIPAMLLAGLAVTRDLVSEQHRFQPSLFAEQTGRDIQRVYYKPGVDTPMDVAARNFEAQMLAADRQMQMHHTL